jgi:iron complex transport system substrate-binding protein
MIKTRGGPFSLIFSLVAVVFLISCGQPSPEKDPSAGNKHERAIAGRTQEKTILHYAHGFRIDYYDHFKLVRVFNHISGKTDTLQYLLVQKGQPVPGGYPDAQVIEIPVQTMIVMSSAHAGLADFAEMSDRITGLGNLQYICSPVIRNNIKAGKVNQVGLDGNLNNELIIAMHPGVMTAMGNPDANFGRYKTLNDAGVPVILISEWLEDSPLGKAEWVKLMAALVNKEELINKKFDTVAEAYNRLAQLGSQATTKPHVIMGLPYKGSWFTPAGESYEARFLKDAGAAYKWSDSKGTGSLALGFESVAPEALTADYWLNIGYVNTKKEVADKDSRYAGFRPFKTGQMYNNNNLVNDLGSNDYWESGEVSPQVILADLIRILHPELLPGHSLVYYKQLP